MLKVAHREYGEGMAICFQEVSGKTYIVVDFGEKKEKFLYPDAFADELEAKDPEIARAIAEELAR